MANDSGEQMGKILDNLEKAKKANTEFSKYCENCRSMDTGTSLSSGDGTELHQCRQCGRVITDKEYYQWKKSNKTHDQYGSQ